MTPIRKDEKEYNLNRARNLFRDKAQSVNTEIQQKAQELSDKKKPTFQKLIKVDKKMTALIEAEKKYKKHLDNKDATEKKLFLDMQKKAKEVSEHLTRVSNVRNWSKSFNNYSIREVDSPASGEFIDDLNTCCYDESYKYIEDNHKLRKVLQDLHDKVEAVFNMGLSLHTAQIEAKKIYNEAGIEYYIPPALLALPSK
tara:strand:+ start:76 stop:669 length:594 start_codon:yes stop_codon:yes gene_type:complete